MNNLFCREHDEWWGVKIIKDEDEVRKFIKILKKIKINLKTRLKSKEGSTNSAIKILHI